MCISGCCDYIEGLAALYRSHRQIVHIFGKDVISIEKLIFTPLNVVQ